MKRATACVVVPARRGCVTYQGCAPSNHGEGARSASSGVPELEGVEDGTLRKMWGIALCTALAVSADVATAAAPVWAATKASGYGHQVAADPYTGVYVRQFTHTAKQNSYAYPQVEGLTDARVQARLNQFLASAGQPKPDHATDAMTTSFALVERRGAFMELMLYSYDYAQGAAHGMPGQTVVMMNLADGAVYHIGDLFKPGVQYLPALSASVRAADTTHELDYFSKFTGVKADDGFILTDEGVNVFFSPYEWTAYALGFPSFTVPYAKISSLVNRGGSLWQALHSPAAAYDVRTEREDVAKIHALGYVLTGDSPDFTETSARQGVMLYVWMAHPRAVTDGSAVKLFFFLNNQYLGTDTYRDHGPVYNLVPTGKGTIAVTYEGSQKDFTIHFQLVGRHMQMQPAFPTTYGLWSKR